MLVTFRTKAWSSITVFGDLAQTLLKMAGHGGSIPGAFAADDVPAAHARLRQAMIAARELALSTPRKRDRGDEEDSDDADAMRDRALRMGAEHPLVHLLAAAAAQHTEVTWSSGAPVI